MDQSNLGIEDLLSDFTFCEYCLGVNEQSVAYWTSWIKAHPERQLVFSRAKNLYFVLNGDVSSADFERDYAVFCKAFEHHIGVSKILSPFTNRPLPQKSSKVVLIYSLLSGLTACVLLATGIYFLLKPKPLGKSNAYTSVYFSPIGKRRSLTLSDGTSVRLNSGSKLTVLPGYNHHKREVMLEGEAYFTVVHNAKSPFSVHTLNFRVNDLGTVFNVKAYSGDKTFEAVLIKGSIEVVLNNKQGSRVILTPSKKIVLNNSLVSNLPAGNSNKAIPVYKIKGIANNVFKNSIVETDWTANKLSFYDEPFEDIAPVIERWYGLKLIVNNKELDGYHFTATFGNQSIDQVLKALKLTANFNYRREGNVITIY
jgi:transmembrane sensor